MLTQLAMKCSILVVEDDHSTAALVSKELLRSNYHVQLAHTAEDAIALLEQGSYALVLLDYLLDNTCSWDVLHAARKASPPVPVIVVTGRGSETVAIEALRNGATDYVIKNGEYWKNLPQIVARITRVAVPTPATLRDNLHMSEVSDDDFLRELSQLGEVTVDQVANAQKVRAEIACNGTDISLADVLQCLNIITKETRDKIEKTVLSAQQGRIDRLGQYRLIKKLGEGGMGIVYLAEDEQIGRKVALKVLSSRISNPDFVTRFRREAKATAKLSHPNIVMAYAAGEDHGYHYYAMEYCVGELLDAKLKREKSLAPEVVLELGIQVVRGLNHAHERGIVHRDIKPANIFMEKAGMVKILDMGLSKEVSACDQQSFLTQSGLAIGTPHYMSPEQVRGEKMIDGRSDIYSLGATMFHLMTGRTPFDGATSPIVMLKHLNDPLPDPRDINPDIPRSVADTLQRMLEKIPSNRFQDCMDLILDFDNALGQIRTTRQRRTRIRETQTSIWKKPETSVRSERIAH